MRAAVAAGPGRPLAVEAVELLPPGRGQVVVRMHAAGVCHSDLNALEGRSAPPGWPLISGHEGLGEVERIGDGVDGMAVGDRVLFSFVASCQRCFFCVRGERQLCTRFRSGAEPKGTLGDGHPVFGHAGLGAFAELALVDHRSLVPIRSALPPSQLALVSCGVTTGVMAVQRTGVEPASAVVVLGVGGVGLAAVQAARIAGATTIVAVDPAPGRRALACRVGATQAFDPADPTLESAVRELTDGRGADHAFDAVGRADVAAQGFSLLRRGGTLVLIGAAPGSDRPAWSLYEQMRDSKTVRGALYGDADPRRDFPRIVALAESGVLNLDAMVTAHLSLDQVNDGIAALHAGSGLRSVLVF